MALAERYGRYGYRKISALLKAAGWLVNDKRVERIWRREGLKVPVRQPKRGRIWDNDGTVRNSVCGRRVEHQAAMARVKRSPKMTANCALAMTHSRGPIFHAFSERFKTK